MSSFRLLFTFLCFRFIYFFVMEYNVVMLIIHIIHRILAISWQSCTLHNEYYLSIWNYFLDNYGPRTWIFYIVINSANNHKFNINQRCSGQTCTRSLPILITGAVKKLPLTLWRLYRHFEYCLHEIFLDTSNIVCMKV
jgi:hypothetical protein